MRHQFRGGGARLFLFVVAALTCLMSGAPSAGAESAAPHIVFIFPAGGQKGKTVEASVTGFDVHDATAVRVSGEGVTAKVIESTQPATEKPVAGKKPAKSGKQTKKTESVRIAVTIAADASPGMRDLRLVTSGGVSNRCRFLVTQLPEVIEVEPNSTTAKAQRVAALPFMANGQIFGADADVYRFPAKAGQTIVCEVYGRRLLPFIADAVPGWMQATLTLYDTNGRELMYVDDFRFKPDPVLIYPVARDGEYLIEVKDALYRGREDFVYRLSVGALPYITDIYPLGGARNTTTTVKLTGVNLDRESLSVEVSADSPPLQHLGETCGGHPTNVVPFGVGDLAEMSETEDNNSPEKANRVKSATLINGRIQKPGDVDFFVFTAEAKQTLVIDVHARRLDSPLDSIITLTDSSGKELAQNDDTVDEAWQMVTHHADSRLVHTFAAAGDYTIRLCDIQDKSGQEYAYRLSITPPQQDFALRVLPDTLHVAPGETTVLMGDVVRMDGFDGEVKLSLDGLPKGFAVRGAVIPAGEGDVRFTITAPTDAPVGLLSPLLSGTAEIAGQTVTRRASPAEEVQQAFSYMHRVPTQEFLLAVTTPTPSFTLSTELATDEVVEIEQNNDVTVVVRAVRGEGVTGAINVTADAPPKGLTVRTATIPKDGSETTVTLRAGRLTPGFMQNVILTGTMRRGKDTITRYVPVVPIRVIAAPERWALDLPAGADGVEANGGWAVDSSWSRPGKITVKSEPGRGRHIEVACGGDEDKKLAIVVHQHMDVSKATWMDVAVTNPTGATLKVAAAFAAASDWKIREAPSIEVAPGKEPTRISFRLDQANFKSADSEWKHVQTIPNRGIIDKMLIIVEGLPENGTVCFDQIRCRAAASGGRAGEE